MTAQKATFQDLDNFMCLYSKEHKVLEENFKAKVKESNRFESEIPRNLKRLNTIVKKIKSVNTVMSDMEQSLCSIENNLLYWEKKVDEAERCSCNDVRICDCQGENMYEMAETMYLTLLNDKNIVDDMYEKALNSCNPIIVQDKSFTDALNAHVNLLGATMSQLEALDKKIIRTHYSFLDLIDSNPCEHKTPSDP